MYQSPELMKVLPFDTSGRTVLMYYEYSAILRLRGLIFLQEKLAYPLTPSKVYREPFRNEGLRLDDRKIFQRRFALEITYFTSLGHHRAKPDLQLWTSGGKASCLRVPTEAHRLTDQAAEIQLHFNRQWLG